jgi:release factor glutamine methyltransferase
MTLHYAQHSLLFQLYHIYDNSEAQQIADLVMEHLTGWKRIDRVMNKSLPLRPDTLTQLEVITHELLQHKPVQYILHEAWFAGMPLYVDEHVLIPRPETEELVDWIVKSKPRENSTILDIGTGSGCIALALKKYIPTARVFACDVSADAIHVAQKNARQQELEVNFIEADITNHHLYEGFQQMDLVVSNPPYIPVADKASMRDNVLKYEPWLALFVDDNDPLLFYKAIAAFADHKLTAGGSIFVEIHEDLAAGVRTVFETAGFRNIEIKKDMQGKERMVRAQRGA